MVGPTMIRLSLFRSPLAVIALAISLTALAADTNVDAQKSKVTATFKQEGVPVEAPFLKFSGRIVYDPKNAGASTAALDVDTGSFDIGDEAYNAEARKKEWFDSGSFPKASFRSTAIKPGAAGKFDATGTLTVKGKVLTITVPISVQTTAGGSAFDGSFVMSRKAFGIGGPAWDEVLDDKVNVRFHLISTGR